MRKVLWVMMGVFVLGWWRAAAAPAEGFDGQRAFEAVKAQTDLGVRAPGTSGHDQCRQWIQSQFAARQLTVSTQTFDVRPAAETLHLTNVIGTLRGRTDDLLVVGAHYDTKTFHDITFVGANDGASGVGVLLELARDLATHGPFQRTLQFVALDGEEAIDREPIGVGLYGSTHYVKVARRSGDAGRIKAFILLDMIGDQRLDINNDLSSDRTLHTRIWTEAARQHVADHFGGPDMEVVDDHTPFLQAGIPAIDLIDFQYGSGPTNNDYWHTAQDTLDKIRPESLQMVGRVVDAVVRDMAR